MILIGFRIGRAVSSGKMHQWIGIQKSYSNTCRYGIRPYIKIDNRSMQLATKPQSICCTKYTYKWPQKDYIHNYTIKFINKIYVIRLFPFFVGWHRFLSVSLVILRTGTKIIANAMCMVHSYIHSHQHILWRQFRPSSKKKTHTTTT